MDSRKDRRSFLAKSVELAATVPLIHLIVQNFRNRTSYYDIDGLNYEKPDKFSLELAEVHRLSAAFNGSIDNLLSNYSQAYHRAHTRLVPYSRQVNGKTETGVEVETYYTWEEPDNVPKNEVIDNWKNFHWRFFHNLNELAHEETISLPALRDLSVVERRTNVGREGLASLGIYTPEIAALLFYEEAIALVKHDDGGSLSPGQIVEKYDSPSQITRRSFFKVGAALTGALASGPIISHNAEKRAEGKSILDEEILEMKRLREISEAEAFSKYFGISPKEFIEGYRHQLNVSDKTIKSGIKDKRVNGAFFDFTQIGRKFVYSLDKLFQDGVSMEMGDLMKAGLVTRSLKEKANSEHMAVYTGLAVTGLAVGGAMAATLIPLEAANEYFTNKFEKK